MYILGLETATQVCGAALLKDDQWIADYHLNQKNVHAAKLMNIIKLVLDQGGISVSDVDAVAVSIGPGSFTGLRIGLSVAKGLALGSNIPIVAVPTFDGLAEQAPIPTGTICPVLKSRSFEYFYAIYDRHNFVNTLKQEPRLVPTDNIMDVLPENALIVGQVQELQSNKKLNGRYIFAPTDVAKPSALHIARLGMDKFKSGETAVFETLEPMYYQDFIAGKPK